MQMDNNSLESQIGFEGGFEVYDPKTGQSKPLVPGGRRIALQPDEGVPQLKQAEFKSASAVQKRMDAEYDQAKEAAKNGKAPSNHPLNTAATVSAKSNGHAAKKPAPKPAQAKSRPAVKKGPSPTQPTSVSSKSVPAPAAPDWEDRIARMESLVGVIVGKLEQVLSAAPLVNTSGCLQGIDDAKPAWDYDTAQDDQLIAGGPLDPDEDPENEDDYDDDGCGSCPNIPFPQQPPVAETTDSITARAGQLRLFILKKTPDKYFRRVLSNIIGTRFGLQNWPVDTREQFMRSFVETITHPEYLANVVRFTSQFQNGSMFGDEQLFRLAVLTGGIVVMYSMMARVARNQ
jgi:hypothetical protein